MIRHQTLSALLVFLMIAEMPLLAVAEHQKAVSLLDGVSNTAPAAEVVEIVMPDGSRQQGFVKDGRFIRLETPTQPSQTLKGEVKAENAAEPTDKQGEATKLLVNAYPLSLDNPKIEKTLNRHYEAYRVVIENHGPNAVDIINGEVTNGIDGYQAFETAKRNTGGRAIGWWLAFGAIGAGVSAARNSSRNKATRSASMGFEKKLPAGPLAPGDQVEINTFVPLGSDPQVRVVFKDQKTGELLYANR